MPTPKLIIVIGLPGSGKSHASREFGIAGDRIFDDCFFDKRPEMLQLPGAIKSLQDGQDCVVNDVALCEPSVLDYLVRRVRREVPHMEIVYHYFANDPASCIQNVNCDHKRENSGILKRENFDTRTADEMQRARLGEINRLSRIYSPPEGEKVHPIHVEPFSS